MYPAYGTTYRAYIVKGQAAVPRLFLINLMKNGGEGHTFPLKGYHVYMDIKIKIQSTIWALIRIRDSWINCDQ